MGSERLPGKVLAPIRDRPLLAYLLESLQQWSGIADLIIATSTNSRDDPIADYCDWQDLVCYRGSESNVASRFYELATRHDWEAFFRISADSPLFDYRLLEQAVTLFGQGSCDLVTNIYPRTFPRGQSVELLRTDAFVESYPCMHTDDDREHMTRYFYRNSEKFVIRNLTSEIDSSHLQMAVDTPDDLLVVKRVLAQMRQPHWSYSLEQRMTLWSQQQTIVKRRAA
jgi:spore coat polysaccharide biosynthesis protein SpsF (cytidylyltransferase family)